MITLQTTLADYLATKNAATVAWVAEDPENRWGVTLMEDISEWSKMGVTTPAELDHHLAVSTHYDLFKEINGFRPRHIVYSSLTTEEIEAMTDELVAVEQSRREYEEAERARIELAYAQTREVPRALTHNPFAGLQLLS